MRGAGLRGLTWESSSSPLYLHQVRLAGRCHQAVSGAPCRPTQAHQARPPTGVLGRIRGCPGHGPFSCPHTSQALVHYEALKPQVPLDTAFLPLLPGGSFSPSPSQDHPQLRVVKTPPTPNRGLDLPRGVSVLATRWLVGPLWTAHLRGPQECARCLSTGGSGPRRAHLVSVGAGSCRPLTWRSPCRPRSAPGLFQKRAPLLLQGEGAPLTLTSLFPRPQPLIALVILRKGFVIQRDI